MQLSLKDKLTLLTVLKTFMKDYQAWLKDNKESSLEVLKLYINVRMDK